MPSDSCHTAIALPLLSIIAICGLEASPALSVSISSAVCQDFIGVELPPLLPLQPRIAKASSNGR